MIPGKLLTVEESVKLSKISPKDKGKMIADIVAGMRETVQQRQRAHWVYLRAKR